MTKIQYPGSDAISIELPYFFKTEDDDGNEMFGRIEGHVITILRFVSIEQSVVIFSRVWHPDHFPALDTGNPFDCKPISKERFEQAQLRAAKMLRIL